MPEQKAVPTYRTMGDIGNGRFGGSQTCRSVDRRTAQGPTVAVRLSWQEIRLTALRGQLGN
jgi:hypothetical protein